MNVGCGVLPVSREREECYLNVYVYVEYYPRVGVGLREFYSHIGRAKIRVRCPLDDHWIRRAMWG